MDLLPYYNHNTKGTPMNIWEEHLASISSGAIQSQGGFVKVPASLSPIFAQIRENLKSHLHKNFQEISSKEFQSVPEVMLYLLQKTLINK